MRVPAAIRDAIAPVVRLTPAAAREFGLPGMYELVPLTAYKSDAFAANIVVHRTLELSMYPHEIVPVNAAARALLRACEVTRPRRRRIPRAPSAHSFSTELGS